MDSEGKRRTIRIGVWVAILGLLLGVLSSVIMATSADAHAELRSVSPQDGSTVATAPTQVVLTFSEAVAASFATVTVAGPGGAVSDGKAVVDGVTVTQALAAELPTGRYTVSFRVVSDDGHPVSDRTTFTVAAAVTPTTPESATTGPSATSGSSSTATTAASAATAGPASSLPDDPAGASDGRTLRIGLAVGVAALALAAGTALVASSRRRSGE